MTVQTQDSGNLNVLLTDSTQVLEPEGVFRKKHLAMTALVLGLLVEVQGSYKDHNQLVADKVTIHGSDLKTSPQLQHPPPPLIIAPTAIPAPNPIIPAAATSPALYTGVA